MDRISKLESSLLSQPYNLSVFPIHILKGHNSWITALVSFNDEKNIAAGDDSGEVIIWDIINQKLLYRLTYIRNPGVVPFITLTVPYQ
jgi:WD40 repeat protein